MTPASLSPLPSTLSLSTESIYLLSPSSVPGTVKALRFHQWTTHTPYWSSGGPQVKRGADSERQTAVQCDKHSERGSGHRGTSRGRRETSDLEGEWELDKEK